MRYDNLHIPVWVRKALLRASDSGLVELPRTGWNQVTMASFFRMDQRCWHISDCYSFDSNVMICDPESAMTKDNPIVVEQCNFLSSVLQCRYEIEQVHDGVRVKFFNGVN